MQKHLVLFGCCIISLTIGSVYSFGNIQPYFASYVAYSNHHDSDNYLSVNYRQYQYQTNAIYCLLIIFQSIAMSFGNKLYLQFGFQRSCLLGCFMVSLGIGLTYFTCIDIFLSSLTYGILFGIGCGIVYPSLILCCMSWWPNHKKSVAALISCFYGLGACVFNLVQSYFINPSNLPLDPQFGYTQHQPLMHHFPDVFVLLAFVFSLLQVIGILCLKNPTALDIATVKSNYYATPNIYPSVMDHDMYYYQFKEDQYAEDYTVKQCFYNREFWKLCVITMLQVTVYMFIVALYQDFCVTYLGVTDALHLSVIGSVASVFHGLFRLGYGYFYDLFFRSFKAANSTTSVLLAVFIATLSYCKYGWMIFVWQIVLFSCLGAIYTFIPKCIAQTFGITHCAEISCVIILSEVPAAILFGAISTNLAPSITAYNYVLIAMTTFGVLSIILTLSFSANNVQKAKKKKRVPISRDLEERGASMGDMNHMMHRYEIMLPPYLAVIGGMLIMITIATTFCFGNIKPYIASYLVSKVCQDTNQCHNASQMKDLYQEYTYKTNWVFCIAVIFEAIASVLGGKLELYFGAEYCALLGSAILSLGCALTYFTIHNLYGVILTYGMLFGFGAGLAYPAVVVCVMRWWPSRIGVSTGFIYAGFGFGAFIFDMIQTLYVNIEDIHNDPSTGFVSNQHLLERVPPMFLVIASVFLSMQILGVLLMSSNTDMRCASMSQHTYMHASTHTITDRTGTFSESAMYGSGMECAAIDADCTASQALCTYKFWQLFAISMLNMIVFLFITSEWKLFMNDYLNINDDLFNSAVGSVSALCNGLFRILWGLYYDCNQSFAISMGTMTTLLTIFTATLSFCKDGSYFSSKMMISSWYLILFSCIGGSFSFYPKVICATFGYTYSGIIIGCLLLAQIPAALTFCMMPYSMHNMLGRDDEWRNMTIAMAILSFISCVLSVTYTATSTTSKSIANTNVNSQMHNKYPLNSSINCDNSTVEFEEAKLQNV